MSRLLPVVAVLVLTIMLSTGIALGLTASRVPTALQSSPAATSTAANGSGALPSPSAPLATAQRTATAGVAGLAGTSGPPGSPTEEPARTSTPLPRTPTHTATASPIAAVLATAIQATAIQAATDTPTTADTARSVSPVNPSPTATAVPTTAPTAPPQGEPRTPTPSAGPDLAATAQAAAQQQTATAQGASLEATSASIAATATAVSRTFVGCPTQAPGGTFSTQGERLAVTVSMRYLCRMGQLVAGQDARWIVFDVEMLNRSDAPAEINPLYFTLVNGEGRTQRPDNLAYLLPQPLPSRRLLANRTARGQIAFYTKRDFNPAHLVWRDFEEAIVIRLVRE